MVRLSLSKLHPKITASFWSRYFLSKTEGLGMASNCRANCMDLRLVRVWHQPLGCIPTSPFALDSVHHSVKIPYRNKSRIPYTAVPWFSTKTTQTSFGKVKSFAFSLAPRPRAEALAAHKEYTRYIARGKWRKNWSWVRTASRTWHHHPKVYNRSKEW